MGGMDGFGPVDPDESGPVFHGKWEGQVMAASRVMGAVGAWNIDQGRYGIEQLPPHLYLTSYYHRWLARCEWALVKYGYADTDEIAAGNALRPGKPPPRGKFTVANLDRISRRGRLHPAAVRAPALRRGRSTSVPARRTFIPRAIPGCPATCPWSCRRERAVARLSGLPATALRRARVKTHNGSTRSASTGATCGAPIPIRR